MHYIILYGLLLAISLVNCTEVVTTSGKARGKFNSDDIASYYSFTIPYAESPTGDLRFKPPVPFKPRNETIDATKTAPICQQPRVVFNDDSIKMSEDCLFVNIYTPKLELIIKLPVLIYVHSGVFSYGSGNAQPILGPQVMMNNNIVVVTFNYRVGALGFLSMGIEEASGNCGVKDIILAMNWINNNIENFGGDPNRITLGGLGASAMMINYLMMIESTKNLFSRAILLSGTALSFRAVQTNPRSNVEELARLLGIEYKNDKELLEKLKQADANKINQVELHMVNAVPNRAFVYNTLFIPCIEKNTTNAVITMDPIEGTKARYTRDIPVLLGMVNQEGVQMFPVISDKALAKRPDLINILNENFELCIPTNIKYPIGSPESKELAKSVREFYFHGGNISVATTGSYVNMIYHTSFVFPIDYWVKLVNDQKRKSPTYYYVTELDSPVNWFKASQNITYPGAAHADDIGFLFVPTVTKSKYEKLDTIKEKAIKVIRNYIFNFIIFGNPSPPLSLQDVKWTEAGPQRAHIVLGDTVRMVPHAPFDESTEFWYKAYAEYDKYKLQQNIKV